MKYTYVHKLSRWYVFHLSLGCLSGPQAEDIKRIAFEGDSSSSTGAPAGGRAGLGVPWRSSDTTRREASVVLIDRTLDLAAPASHGGSLLQRVRYHDEGLVLYEWSFTTTVEAKRGGRVVRVRLDYFSLVGFVHQFGLQCWVLWFRLVG